jgi:hypothetical protein
VATPEHSEPLPLLNYIRIVDLAPDLQKVSVYRVPSPVSSDRENQNSNLSEPELLSINLSCQNL